MRITAALLIAVGVEWATGMRIPIPVNVQKILLGDREITVIWGVAYEEPGFSATDNCDGDISDRVEVSGSVNIFVPRTYALEYLRITWKN